MSPALRQMMIATGLMVAVAVGAAGLVAYTYTTTADEIAEEERQALLRRLNEIVPSAAYDNAITQDVVSVRSELLGGAEPMPVYRARRNGEPVAAILTAIAPDGYSGPIKLLVGIYADGRLAGVRVVAHKETPGLGDAIEAEKSGWITRFEGKSLHDPVPEQWAVKKDGGVFDQFTGATITPRAVVEAVERALRYFEANQATLFQGEAHGG